MAWTDRDIQSFKPIEGQTKPYDKREKNRTGFGVTVFPSGEKSFIYFYTFAGRKRRMTLGKYPECSLKKARTLHREALAILVDKKDPGAEKKKEKIDIRDASTVEGLIEEYIEKWAKPNKRSWKVDLQSLNRDVMPYWGKRKANDISRRDVILLLDGIKDRGAPVQANRVLSCIKTMFNFAIQRDIVSSNPCIGIKQVKEKQCDRVLSEEEIRVLWPALSQHTNQDNPLHTIHMSIETKLALKIQLVTGQRKGEIISAEWDELDLISGWWTIPAGKAKNNQTHRVPLSSLAIELLAVVKKLSKNSRYLFPAKRKTTHITDGSVDKAVNRSTFDGVRPWTPHDLRRTAASHMTSIGIQRLIVSKILNHSEKSVTAIYDQYSYDNEKRSALELWAGKLKEIVYGANSLNKFINFEPTIKEISQI
jgi:integrase